jgi:hypothetical protein
MLDASREQNAVRGNGRPEKLKIKVSPEANAQCLD